MSRGPESTLRCVCSFWRHPPVKDCCFPFKLQKNGADIILQTQLTTGHACEAGPWVSRGLNPARRCVTIAAAISLLSNAVLYFLLTGKQRGGDAPESKYGEAALYALQTRLYAAKAKAMQQ